jgi:hypothetical protein
MPKILEGIVVERVRLVRGSKVRGSKVRGGEVSEVLKYFQGKIQKGMTIVLGGLVMFSI